MHRAASRGIALCLLLLASHNARADFGPDLEYTLLAVAGWPVAVLLGCLLAVPGRRVVWSIVALTGYYALLFAAPMLARLAIGDDSQRITQLWPRLLLAAVIAFVLGMLVARVAHALRRDPPPPDAGTGRIDAACAMLVLSALPLMIDASWPTLQFMGIPAPARLHHALVPLAPWIGSALVCAPLLAAYGLWRHRAWAWWLAVAVVAIRVGAAVCSVATLPGQLGLGGSDGHGGAALVVAPIFLVIAAVPVVLMLLMGCLVLRLARGTVAERFFAADDAPRRWLDAKAAP